MRQPSPVIRGLVTATVFAALGASTALAACNPGEGKSVQPLMSSNVEATFQTLVVRRALEKLGYTVKEITELPPPTRHLAIASGDGTYMADHWDPLHVDFFYKSGGDEKIYREGVYSPGGLQGYLIDKATADKYHITNIAQLKDPEIAKVFDADGDGMADLAGCNPGWGCEKVIEHHIDAYGLRDTVTQKSGHYSAIIADTISRFEQGLPVLYYAWTPYWVSGVMVPGDDVVWLNVPFSALPGARETVDTTLPDGSNYGFQPNDQRIIANKAWTDENPEARTLFTIMTLDSDDITIQNLKMREGEDTPADIMRHTDSWIAAHQREFDGWIKEACETAK